MLDKHGNGTLRATDTATNLGTCAHGEVRPCARACASEKTRCTHTSTLGEKGYWVGELK